MIDDLIKFCLAEIAYEGELGCTVDRLKGLVDLFYEQQQQPINHTSQGDSVTAKMKQNVDAKYLAYIYTLLTSHPSIIIGTVPPDSPTVWIAPPPHKKGSAPPRPPVALNAIEAKGQSLGELETQYGDGLRIAVDKTSCFVSLTGSHNRPSKLSDVVYTTLQIIARTREKGIAIKDLGPITGYDPKSIFYQIQQLVALNLIVKLSRVPSVNWAIHRRFYDRSELWKSIRGQASREAETKNEGQTNDTADEENEEDGNETNSNELHGDEAELLANVPQLRLRVLRLLEKSVNQTHQYTNLILAAGYTSPTKQQRRFFTTRVLQMVDEGLMDKIAVPTPRGNAACLQLTDKGKEYLANPLSTSPSKEMIDATSPTKEEEGILVADVDDEEFVWTENNRLWRNFGLQRQIIEHLDSNPGGVTVTDLSHALGFFDRRTIEQVLTRLCTRVPPRHLANLHPVTVMETVGKMRRQRYFTLEHYQALLAQQNLPDDRYDWIHMNDVGGFSFVDESMVWKTRDDWIAFVEDFQHERRTNKAGKATPAKKKVWKNPVIDGVVKKGRPRKEWTQKDTSAKKKRMQKVDEDGQSEEEVATALDNGQNVAKGKKAKTSKAKASTSAVLDQAVSSLASTVPPTGNLPSVKNVIWVDSSTSPVREDGSSHGVNENTATTSKGPTSKKRSAAVLDDGQQPKSRKKRKIGIETPQTSPEDPVPTAMEVVSSAQLEPGAQNSSAQIVEMDQSGSGPTLPDSSLPQSSSSALISRPPSPDKRRPAKQPKPRPTNVSALRRHQEILDLLQSHGGIMQQNFEMSMLLRDHAQKLANQGVQPGQDAGFLPDKKTIQRAVDALEEMGAVKVLKTAIVDGNRKNSLQQPITIIYLPEKSQEEINAFIEGLHKPYKQTQIPSSARAVIDGVEYSKMSKAKRKKRDKDKDDEVHEVDILAMMGPRRQFLEDRQTVAQLFGFLLGRQRRAQELHLYTLNHMLSDSPASTVISIEQRIISSKFWKEDYPLGSFCAIIPAHSYIPYLESAQHDPVTLNQSLKSLDVRLQRALKVQHARTRHRLLDLLRLLTSLGLITPLQEDDDGSIIIDGSNEGSEVVISRRFEPVDMPLGRSADLPDYWKFSDHAPVWLLSSAKFTSQKIEEPPPFYADVPLSSVEDAAAYWSLLRKLCDRQSNLSLGDTPGELGSAQPFTIPAAELASLCNYRSWTSDYRLSKLQQEYLKGMVDIATLTTPLDDPARLMQAAFITCAPQQVVYDYFSAQKERLVGAATRIERRRLRADGSSRQATKQALSAKAEKHLQNIGSQWDEIVAELVDGDLTPEEEEQLRPLRSRYITVGGQVDREKVKTLISNIVRNPIHSAKQRHKKLTSKTLLPRSVEVEHIEEAMPDIEMLFAHRTAPLPHLVNNPSTDDGFPPLPLIVNPRHERKVADIVSGMGPPPQEPLAPRKKTNGPKVPARRRGRFKWTEEYDELLRDAVAIIRARCRGKSRSVQWQPLETIFPPVRGNNLRTRYQKYIVQPGAKVYMDRLEQAWYSLWQAHKGRPELPDEDPSKAEGCDFVAHIEFLRKYLDKRSLMSDVTLIHPSTENRVELLASVADLEREYEIEEVEGQTFESVIQTYWGGGSSYLNERSHALVSSAFTELKEPTPNRVSLKVAAAQSVIQMIVATEQEHYSEEQATALLRPFGDDLVKVATEALARRGTINPLSKTKAGRTYTMSDSNAEELSGLFPLRRCEDAAALEKIYEEEPDEWHTWPLVTTEGEMATLLRHASNHTADFKIQLPDLKSARDTTQWSSRKIQDEMLESQVAVHFDPPVPLTPSSASDLELSTIKEPKRPKSTKKTLANKKDHGLTVKGEKAACAVQNGAGVLINCSKCLDTAQAAVLKRIPRKYSSSAKALLSRLTEAGEDGVPAEEVWTSRDAEFVVNEITTSTVSLGFWSGYAQCHLISTKFLGSYAVPLAGEVEEGEDKTSLRLTMPRRWVNLRGEIVTATWKAALRAVVGLLIVRPLVDHNRLIQSFKKAYDRLDILAVLDFLERHNIIMRVQDIEQLQHKVGEMTVEEESHTFWEVHETFEWSDLL